MILARKIQGFYSKFRKYVRYALLLFYLALPWLQWNGRPLVLLDIEHRKFYFPGAVFWPQEFYFLLIILLIAGLALFFFTSLYGRLWCGWACPQTVFSEIFDSIGRFVSPRYGKASQKLWEKVLLYAAWLVAAMFLTFHFVAYFVGARVMLSDLSSQGIGIFSAQTWPWFFLALTGLFYFDLAYFQHNFCVYLCPYARFQSVMLDEDSVVIAYDKYRGEPRRKKKIKPGSPEEADWGDCTGCRKCVQVCPTGIDIRDGLQVACINCTHCIDACAEEMSHYNKPSLVDYASTSYFESRKPYHILRPRVVVYASLFVMAITLFVSLLTMRVPMYLSVLRDRSVAPYISNGQANNVYQISIGNVSEKPATFEVRAQIPKKHELLSELHILGKSQVPMRANELKKLRLVLESPLKGKNEAKRVVPIRFVAKNLNTGERIEKETIFTIPAGGKNP